MNHERNQHPVARALLYPTRIALLALLIRYQNQSKLTGIANDACQLFVGSRVDEGL